jgi:hypothetical protein
LPDWNVIADVSQTLQQLLTTEFNVLTPTPQVLIYDLQPNVTPPAPSLTIFIFEIVEDQHSRNKPRVRGNNPLNIQKPPMALLLRYLITPWGGDALTDHRILGRVLQVFYDNSILSGPQLTSGLSNTVEELKITLSPITLDERSRIWYAIQRPYRLSLTYEVRVVYVDTEKLDLLQTVTNRSMDVGITEEIN